MISLSRSLAVCVSSLVAGCVLPDVHVDAGANAGSAARYEARGGGGAGHVTGGLGGGGAPSGRGGDGGNGGDGGKGGAGGFGDAGMPNPPSSPEAGITSDDDGGLDEPPACGTPIDQVDLLFMVDNSNSMAGEQASLRAQFTHLITTLANGGLSPIDGSVRAGVRDLHVGVVSSDMGIPGVEFGNNCHADGGDDGRLQNKPRMVPNVTCDASYPEFLSYAAAANTDRTKLSNDFACIATLGTGGCGFEEQLEAPLKALWPTVYVDAQGRVQTPNPITFLSTTTAGTKGRGDIPPAEGGNLGFLRRSSLIAIVLLTDEDDCSVKTTEHLWPSNLLADDSPYKSEIDINLRCFDHPEFSYDVIERYYKGFRMLRPGHESMVVFAAITGVPTDLVDLPTLRAAHLADDSSRDAFYDNILNDSRMQQRVDPASQPGTGNGNLTTSCSRTVAGENLPSTAYPPRRIVQLAKAFGENGMVQSICQDNLSPAVDAVVDTIAKRLDNACVQH